ncbi:p-hydroxybenzoic acid efflux pump subunit B [Atlantibacter hermannii]|nr:p-hydroxybenzoic acid efflux pump subunit B [Atlantibacter hermannii]
MGIFSIAPQHIRFALKLATAIVLALFIGFHFQLETPRWAVLTAAIVAAGPAFAAGGEPWSGRSATAVCCVSSARLSAASLRWLLLSP